MADEERESQVKYCIFPTIYGYFGIAKGRLGILALVLAKSSREEVVFSLRKLLSFETLVYDPEPFDKIVKSLLKYLEGEREVFEFELDLSRATEFQQRVYRLIKRIPFGQTRSYKWVAENLQIKGAQAVGQALKKNPVPILVPCHRVIMSNGRLGGFSAGINIKRRLLEIEGCLGF